MRAEERTCRLFVLAMLGTIVLAFAMVLGLFHRSVAGKQRHMPAAVRARNR